MKIDNDILLKYILGELSQKESDAIDQLRQSDAELNSDIESLEMSLETLAFDYKVKAPNIKADIIQSIQAEPIKPKSKLKSIWSTILLMTASILGGIGLMSIYSNQKTNQLESRLDQEVTEHNLLKLACDTQNQTFAFLNDKNTQWHQLKGKSSSNVMVYWNEKQKSAKLKCNFLPKLNQNETYQMWADVNGEMLDLGVFDYMAAAEDWIDIKYLDNAESLNITIEPKGGSKTPTVSQLIANIYI